MSNQPKNVLTIDIGGSKVKILIPGEEDRRYFESSDDLTPQEMVDGVLDLVGNWQYDFISIGFPGPVKKNQPVLEPHNLGKGWVDFDYDAAFEKPVKFINDAAMQALGSYQGGNMLFLGLGTGLGSAMIVDGKILPLELAHLPYKKSTYEEQVGNAARKKLGKKKWTKEVFEVIDHLRAAFLPDDIVLGGGNVKKLDDLPKGCRQGDNNNAFEGGFRLWD